MSQPQQKVPLGTILQQAGLVTGKQVEQALKQQKKNHDRKIGDILVSRGRINPQTADFFAERWYELLLEKPQQPIGQYLKQAALLSESQIQKILQEQQQTKQKFGELAIAKGWIEDKTINFFLQYLTSTTAKSKAFSSGVQTASRIDLTDNSVSSNVDRNIKASQWRSPDSSEYGQKVHEGFLNIKRKLLNIDNLENYSEEALKRVLLWTGGQSFLTRKLFQLLADNERDLSPEREIAQIDNLVQTTLLEDWQNNQLSSHFKSIKYRLLNNQHCHSPHLLRLYQRVLNETVFYDRSEAQQELLNMGLVVKQGDTLVVANRIYQSIFNLDWVNRVLSQSAEARDRQEAPTQLHSVRLPDKSSDRTSLGTHHEGSNIDRALAPQYRDRFANLKNIALILISLGLLSIIINTVAKQRAVKIAFQKGNQLLKQKSFSEALARYDRLLEIDSNYFQAWTNRGYALAGLKKYEAMRESCAAATIIKPTAVYAWNCQGEALHNLQRSSEAIVAFDRAIALDRNNPIFLINKSESLKDLGRHEESLKAIETAVGILEQIEAVSGTENISSEFAVALAFLGNGYRREERYQDALNAYTRALGYSNSYFPAQIGKGITLNQAGLYREAQAEFESILDNDNLNKAQQAQTWFYLGKTLCQSRQNALGVAAFEHSLELQPSYTIAEEAIKQCS